MSIGPWADASIRETRSTWTISDSIEPSALLSILKTPSLA